MNLKVAIPIRFKKRLEKRFSINIKDIENNIRYSICPLCEEYNNNDDCTECPFSRFHNPRGCIIWLKKHKADLDIYSDNCICMGRRIIVFPPKMIKQAISDWFKDVREKCSADIIWTEE